MENNINLAPGAALERLVEGNRRFANRLGRTPSLLWTPDDGARDQRPFAVVLGCSDSRMPVELLFDQGFGDLFVVRVAGAVVAPSIIGSVEFAASRFGTRLAVVLGHTRCGAVGATLDAATTGMGPDSEAIRAITDRIAPAVARLVPPNPETLDAAAMARLRRDAVHANTRASVSHLRESPVLRGLVDSGRLAIVGAEFSLETGGVTFLAPEPRGRPDSDTRPQPTPPG